MRTITRVTLLISLIASLMSQSVSAQATDHVAVKLRYSTDAPNYVDVTMQLPPGESSRILIVPRSVPMGYGEAPYDRFYDQVAARDADGKRLTAKRQRRGPRFVFTGEATQVQYRVDLRTMEREILSGSDASKVRNGYVGILGYSVFAYFEDTEDLPVRLTIEAPQDWSILTTLAPSLPLPKMRAIGEAANFYALADSQVVLGTKLRVQQIEADIPLFLSVFAEDQDTEDKVDTDYLARQVKAAQGALSAYFGTTPFPHYCVICEYLQPQSTRHQYGFSMEHLDSATLVLPLDRRPLKNESAKQHRRSIYNLAHHIAHSWIPKRCAGPGYYPFAWEIAPVLDSIWFSEGFGQYIAAAAMGDALPKGNDFRDSLVANRFRRNVQLSPKFLNAMSLVEVSRIASTRYSSDFRTGLNVFARGGLIAAAMDDEIRRATAGEKSFRDLARYLMTLADSKYTFDLDRLAEHCKTATGVDVSKIIEAGLGPYR